MNNFFFALALVLGSNFAGHTLLANTPAPSLAVNDEPHALGVGLVRELRQGGFIIYLRHGATQPGTNDVRNGRDWWKNCATTQRTSQAALPNAQAITNALIRQMIPISDVQSSEFCRAYDTGVFLGLVAPIRNAALNDVSAFVSQKRTLADLAGNIVTLLSTPPAYKQNRILVGHALPPTIVHPMLAHVQEGHTLIFRPEGNGRFHFVTSVSPGQWQLIGKLPVANTSQIIVPTTTPQATAQPIIAGAPQVVQPPVAPQPPMIDPARELKGLALVQALRKGGYNLYMRHAQANVGSDQDLLKTPMWWENCAIQRNMSDTGREQAKKVGLGIRTLKVPVGEVKASQFCRVRETATLMDVGAVVATEELNHVIGQRVGTDINATRFKLLATPPAKGKNNVLVSHTHGSSRNEERIMSGIQEGEVVVYQPDGKGNAEPVGRIAVTEWENLVQLTQQPQQQQATSNAKAK
jgi:phosphohistidine phosphatase SixA